MGLPASGAVLRRAGRRPCVGLPSWLSPRAGPPYPWTLARWWYLPVWSEVFTAAPGRRSALWEGAVLCMCWLWPLSVVDECPGAPGRQGCVRAAGVWRGDSPYQSPVASHPSSPGWCSGPPFLSSVGSDLVHPVPTSRLSSSPSLSIHTVHRLSQSPVPLTALTLPVWPGGPLGLLLVCPPAASGTPSWGPCPSCPEVPVVFRPFLAECSPSGIVFTCGRQTTALASFQAPSCCCLTGHCPLSCPVCPRHEMPSDTRLTLRCSLLK